MQRLHKMLPMQKHCGNYIRKQVSYNELEHGDFLEQKSSLYKHFLYLLKTGINPCIFTLPATFAVVLHQ